MKRRRGSTWSPMSIEKSWSAACASSTSTRMSSRAAGSIVVAQSCSAFISPRPLKRESWIPASFARSSAPLRSSENVCPTALFLPSVRDDEVGGVVAVVGAQPGRPALEFRERAREPLPAGLRQLHLRFGAVPHVELVEPLSHEQLLELGLLLEVELLVAELHPVERRHGDVDMTGFDQLGHLPVEEGEDQRADVRAVDVGVRHDDDAVVADAGDVELVADPGADRGDHRLDLVVRENLVDPVLLAVDDLSA